MPGPQLKAWVVKDLLSTTTRPHVARNGGVTESVWAQSRLCDSPSLSRNSILSGRESMASVTCIVSATDYSAAADRAVRRAASLGSSLGGVLHVIHILPPRELLAQLLPPPPENEIAALRKRAGDALQDRVRLAAASFAVTPSWALFHGYAHEALLDAVRMLAADLIVVGAQGEHGGSSSLETVGETAMKLAQRSAVPILLARRGPREP